MLDLVGNVWEWTTGDFVEVKQKLFRTVRVEHKVLRGGAYNTKTEALRLALFEFDRSHRIVPDEETAYAAVAGKILEDVASGKMKTKPFSIREL